MTAIQSQRGLGLCLLAAAASLHAGIARADGDDDIVERVLNAQGLSELSLEQLLDQPVVTASGKAEERSLAAANVFIITRDEIERRGYHSLGEILRRVPGMYLVYDYVNYSVGVREVTGGYKGGTRIVKIMVDGFPVSFRPDLEAFLGPEFIPVETIERVEVAKGPLSALYGANAFLATVNVITREPEDREVAVLPRYMIVNGNPGEGATAIAQYAGTDRGFMLAASFDRIDRSGVKVRKTYEFQDLSDAYFAEPTQDDLAHPVSAFGRFDYHHDKLGDFRLEVGHQELDAKGEFQLNSVLTHRSRISLWNRWATLNWQRPFGDRLKLRAYVGGSHGGVDPDYQLFLTNNFSSGFRPNFGYKAFNALAELSYDFGPWLQVDLGTDTELRNEDVLYYTEISYESDSSDPFSESDLISADADKSHALRQVGTYVQLHSTPFASLPDFRLNAAARGDFIEFGPFTYPFQTSLRGAIVYRFSPLLTTKLIGGRAFQTPSGTLLFAHSGFGFTGNVVGTEQLDDPRGLRPQVVHSVEFVATSQIGDFLSLEASAFYQDLNDVIRFNQVGPLVVAKNSGREVTAGGELVANLRLGAVRPYAAVSASRQVSAELTRDLVGITSFDGSPSLYPRLFGYVGFDLDLIRSKLFLNTELRYASPRGASQANFYQNDSTVYDLPAYQELDVTLATGDLPLLDPELGTRFLVSVRNLFAGDHIEPGFAGVDIPQPETAAFFQIKQAL
jgi:outer membrane receptor protein involved in Fe transport